MKGAPQVYDLLCDFSPCEDSTNALLCESGSNVGLVLLKRLTRSQ